MKNSIAYDPSYLAFQDAYRQAKALAYGNPESHAVIYRRTEPARIEVGVTLE